MNLTGKVMSFLFELFLETGPSVEKMRWKLNQICGICSDYGTEHEIVDVADCLPEFFQWIGSPVHVPRQGWLMPRAVYSCGWHHKWDHIAQEVGL